jgi:ribosomal protein S8
MLDIILKYKYMNLIDIKHVMSITKPSCKIYRSIKQLWKINFNFWLILLSTHQGIFFKFL